MSNSTQPSEQSPLLSPRQVPHAPLERISESSSTTENEDSESEDLERHDSIDQGRAAQFSGNPEIQKQLKYIIPAVSIGCFLSAADQTIIVSSYGRIGSDLHALNLTSFIATSYFLSLTSFQPLYGKLSDIFGRKVCLLYSYAIFGIGCLCCGLSQNIYQLIAARVFQGIGGGGMTTVVSILVSDIVPLKDRGLWQGLLNVIYSVGAASGAPLGGALSDFVSWRFAFLFQVPLCLFAFLAVFFTLKLPAKEKLSWREGCRRIDFAGSIVLVCAVTCLIFGLDRGSNDSWKKAISYTPLSISMFLFAFFVFIEMNLAAEPFAPGYVIFDSGMIAAYLCNFFSFGAWIAAIYYLPLYWQAVDDVNATTASLRLLPCVVSSVIGSVLAGLFMRRSGKYYWLTVGCYALFVAGILVILLFSGLIINDWRLNMSGTVLGAFASGIGVTTTLIALISNAMPEDQAVATACSYLFRSLGSVIGVSLSATTIQQVLRQQLRASLGSGKEADKIERHVRQSLDYLKTLDPKLQLVVRQAYETAVVYGFGLILVFAFGAFCASWFIREQRLSR